MEIILFVVLVLFSPLTADAQIVSPKGVTLGSAKTNFVCRSDSSCSSMSVPLTVNSSVTVSGNMGVAGSAFSVGGSTFVVAGGKVGIGVVPVQPLDVRSETIQSARFTSTTDTNYVMLTNSGGSAYIHSNNNDLVFDTTAGASEKMRITSAGNVGIATTTYTNTLEVGGSINAQEIRVNGAILSPGTGSNWSVSGGDVYRLTGNVGIGLNNPTIPLQVEGNAYVSGSITSGGVFQSVGNATVGNAVGATNVTLNLAGVVNKAARIVFKQGSTESWLFGNGPASEDNKFALYNGVTGKHTFIVDNVTDNIGFMGGNVGIGTTAPGELLDVSARADIAGPAIRLTDTSPANADSRNWNIANAKGTSDYGSLGFHVSVSSNATPAGAPVMVLTKERFVGIGTKAPGTALEIGSTGKFSNGVDTKANILAYDPVRAGEMIYCSNCASSTICVSTGTAVGDMADIGDRTVACN